MLHAIHNAILKARRSNAISHVSLINALEFESNKIGVDIDVLIEHYEKLYPGELHPLITAKTKRKSR